MFSGVRRGILATFSGTSLNSSYIIRADWVGIIQAWAMLNVHPRFSTCHPALSVVYCFGQYALQSAILSGFSGHSVRSRYSFRPGENSTSSSHIIMALADVPVLMRFRRLDSARTQLTQQPLWSLSSYIIGLIPEAINELEVRWIVGISRPGAVVMAARISMLIFTSQLFLAIGLYV